MTTDFVYLGTHATVAHAVQAGLASGVAVAVSRKAWLTVGGEGQQAEGLRGDRVGASGAAEQVQAHESRAASGAATRPSRFMSRFSRSSRTIRSR